MRVADDQNLVVVAELWITRRELEHMGDSRTWGGKYSEDQIDTALPDPLFAA